MQLQHFSSATLFLICILAFACAFVASPDRSEVRRCDDFKSDQFVYKAFLNGRECEQRGTNEMHCTEPVETKGEELKVDSTLTVEVHAPPQAYYFQLTTSLFLSDCEVTLSGTYTYKDEKWTTTIPIQRCSQRISAQLPKFALHTSTYYGENHGFCTDSRVYAFESIESPDFMKHVAT